MAVKKKAQAKKRAAKTKKIVRRMGMNKTDLIESTGHVSTSGGGASTTPTGGSAGGAKFKPGKGLR